MGYFGRLTIFIIAYTLLGFLMVLWDFRKLLFRARQGRKQDYLVKPLFLESLTIEVAIVFVLIWPYKLLRRRD